LIAEAFEQMGHGRAFRQQHTFLQGRRANDKENERQHDTHKEARQLIEEFEPSEAEFQITLAAYMEALDDPRLDNEATGEHDFDLKAELLGVVKKDHPGMFDRVENFLRESGDTKLRAISPEAADGVKQLREDQETLKPYWEQVDLAVSQINIPGIPDAQSIYRGYQELSPSQQTDVTTPMPGDNEAVLDEKKKNLLVVNHVKKEIKDWLDEARLGPEASEIRAALVRQEYSNAGLLTQIVAFEELVGAR